MNDELSDDVEKKFMLPLTTELQDYKEKYFITPQSSLHIDKMAHSSPYFSRYVLIKVNLKWLKPKPSSGKD